MRLSPLLLCAMLALPVAHAQRQTDGFTMQEIPGIALVKPQSWSKDSDAAIIEFTGYIDRTATGHGGAGYYEFRLPSGQRRQYDTGKVTKLVEYPDAARVRTLAEPSDRDKVAATIRDIQNVIQRFPATRAYLAARLEEFAKLLEKYDGGQVKLDGQWIPKRAYQDSLAAKYAEILKEEIAQAQPPGSLDLENDPKFVALQALAAESPTAKALVVQLTQTQTGKLRIERRKRIASQLEDPELTPAACRKLVQELATLSPAEDPGSAALLEKWNAALAAVDELRKEAVPVAAALETLCGPGFDPAAPPPTGPGHAATAFSEKYSRLLSSGLPPQLLPELAQADGVAEVSRALKLLPGLFSERQFLDAKNVLDAAAEKADAVGPRTAKAVSEMQKVAAARIELFSRAREEARVLADGGKPAEAIVKYEEAYAIIPDGGVARIIEGLRAAASAQ